MLLVLLSLNRVAEFIELNKSIISSSAARPVQILCRQCEFNRDIGVICKFTHLKRLTNKHLT